MSISSSHLDPLQVLYAALGYYPQNGLLLEDDFPHAKCHRFALRQAQKDMGVTSVFVLKASDKTKFTPVVYISRVKDDSDVHDIHRSVWSQGLVPFLIVVTDQSYWLCNGFAFRSDKKRNFDRLQFDHAHLNSELSGESLKMAEPLFHLHSKHLRSSVGWRDLGMDGTSRVDQTLLRNLNSLAGALTGPHAKTSRLTLRQAHALIGRMMYILMLRDRDFIDDDWLINGKHSPAPFDEPTSHWSAAAFWRLNADIDGIFNGGAFDLHKSDQKAINAGHIHFVLDVMRWGTSPGRNGDQLSFLEIDFRSLRIETLSSVYELFLSRKDKEAKDNKGAFYTPPFLVDFVLDQLTDHIEFNNSTKTLDPATGSGVFLVGVFRRIIENADYGTNASLPSKKLRDILLRNIFAIEQEWEACQVAALSLYLTMLDYISEEERRDILSHQHFPPGERVFPPLIGQNIIEADFFNEGLLPSNFPAKFNCIVGNPPWKASPQDVTEEMKDTSERRRNDVGRGQLAELFVLETLKRFQEPETVAAFIIPTSSLANEVSRPFRERLSEMGLSSISNLTHLRRILFPGAEHAASVISFSCYTKKEQQVSIYSPVRSSQPITRTITKKSLLWTLLVSPEDTEIVEAEELFSDSNWNRFLISTPIDRRIQDYLNGQIRTAKISFLGSPKNNLLLKRGKGEQDTGVPQEFQVSTRKSSSSVIGPKNYIDECGAKTPSLLDGQTSVVPLPKNILSNVKSGFLKFYSGDVLLAPRNGGKAIYCTYPVAFNDTIFGISSKSTDIPSQNLLKAVGRYLNSNVAQYLLALAAPSVMNDRPRLSKSNFEDLPICINGPDDPRVNMLLETPDAQLNKLVYELLGIKKSYAEAIEEFIGFRSQFKNANIPSAAIEPAEDKDADQYAKMLLSRFSLSSTHLDNIKTHYTKSDTQHVNALWLSFAKSSSSSKASVTKALSAYDDQSANAFTESLFLWRGENGDDIVIVKPEDRQNWTLAKAFSDGEAIIGHLLNQPQIS
ncbi:N-6 DNA methylase [Pseudomonadota bacterium]